MNNSSIVAHIKQVAKCPSFSSFEERLHNYIYDVFNGLTASEEISVTGNNLIFRIGNDSNKPTIALAAHIDKINHYGANYPAELPVSVADQYIEGAMDDSIGVGLLLSIAEASVNQDGPNLLFFLSEMEESKGLKEHPELLKNGGKGYEQGMGARRIARACLKTQNVPNLVITLDTTPLFKGKSGIALYSNHWELTELEATESLKSATASVIDTFLKIDENIQLHNNTNDYLHYGYEFNAEGPQDIVSIALEPAIYPYHQRGEKVLIADIHQAYEDVTQFLKIYSSFHDTS